MSVRDRVDVCKGKNSIVFIYLEAGTFALDNPAKDAMLRVLSSLSLTPAFLL